MSKRPRPTQPPVPREAPAPATAPLSPEKRRLFTGVMLLLPVLFFLLLEGGLRLFGYGADYPLFKPVPEFPTLLHQDVEAGRRFFAREASVPTPNTDYFYREKPEGSFRIIAQGESSTAGYPFYRGGSFPHVLGTRLRLAYPGREIEVVNTAMAAISSYALLDFTDEIIAQRPDVVVIYAGHNEYYGALGAASAESLGRNPALVRLYLKLRGVRTVQFLRALIGRFQRAASGAPEAGQRPDATLMARMVGEQQVPYGSDLFEAGVRQFRSNLRRLLAKYREAGIAVYIGTLASNERDQRPFVTVHAAGADTVAWRRFAEEGLRAVDAGNARAAIAAFEHATRLDSLAADGYFLLGHAYLGAGRPDDARRAFARARDLDALRFRAPSLFNRIIREEARRAGAHVVETEEAMRQASPEGLIGQGLMLEHLHPNLDGYSVLADAFFDAFARDHLLGGPPQPTPPGRVVRLVTPMDSIAGYLRVEQLTTSWPFRPEEAQPFRLDTTRTPRYVVEQARAVMAGKNWLAAADELAGFYEQRGDISHALLTRRAILQQLPFIADTWVSLASLEMRITQMRNRPDRLPYVAGLFQQALALDSTNVPSLAALGAIALQANDRPAAIRFLEAALRHGPNTPQVMYNLAGAYAMAGRREEATALAERLVAMDSTNADFRILLDGLRTGAAFRL